MKVGIRVGEMKKLPSKFKNDENKAFVINSNKRLFTQLFR